MTEEMQITEIKKAIELIQKQFEAFTWDGRTPEETEVQLLKQKVMLLYDRLNQLEFSKNNYIVVERRQEIKQETALEPKIEKELPQEIQNPEIVVEEKTTPVEASTLSPEITIDTKVVLEVQQTRKEVFAEPAATVGGSFDDVRTLHDKISSVKTEVAVADKLKLSPVSDLTKAIGLNEKFLFIRELFNNNSEVFNRVIGEINSCPDLTLATVHAENEIVRKHSVDIQSETYSKFLELVQRRFLK